jgi:hypothetical protein
MNGDERALASLLEQLEEVLRAFGAPVADALQPGLPDDAVRAALAAEGLGAPEELIVWWGWHNGAGVEPPVDGVGVFSVPENRILDIAHVMSLDDSLRNRRWMRRLYDEELGWPDGYPIGWIPILTSSSAAISYCVDTFADGEVAPVYMYEDGGGTPYPPQPQFGSIADMVGAMVRLFDSGEVRRDPQDPRLPAVLPPEGDEVRAFVTWPSVG